MPAGVYIPRVLYTKLRAISIDQPALKKSHRPIDQSRDCEKVMRSLKNPDTPIIEGYQIYHNYVRPHMGLDGKTPAEAAGIKVEGRING